MSESKRFAECFEFDRAGDLRAGKLEHRMAIRTELERELKFNGPLHQVIRAMDRIINRRGYHYVNITFGEGFNAFANPTAIYLNYTHDTSLIVVYFWHELGHVVGMNVFNPQDRTEGWAEEFRIWVANGAPEEWAGQPHPTWTRLKEAIKDA